MHYKYQVIDFSQQTYEGPEETTIHPLLQKTKPRHGDFLKVFKLVNGRARIQR